MIIAGAPHHVTHRGNRRQEIFRDDADRRVYLNRLKLHCGANSVKVWAYVLMPNHVHIVCAPAVSSALSRTIGIAHSGYTVYFNAKYELTGHLWHARYYSVVLSDKHLWNAVRYVERNPVRARLVRYAENFRWSSAAGHCGLRTDPLISDDLPALDWVTSWRRYLREGD
jgi:putative transposase